MSWRRICSDVLSAVWKNPDAWIFHAPVVESPELSEEAKLAYIRFIEKPMDLRTIKQKIQSYDSPAEFEADMLLVFQNCSRFNKPGQDAYEMGKDVEKFFLNKWNEKKNSVYDLFSAVVVTQQDNNVSWRTILMNIFEQIKNDSQFNWFLFPVHQYTNIDIAIKKQYYALIRNPMDLSTIEKNLPIYPSPSEMRRDLELIVTNSVRFNPPESVVNLAARNLQETVNELFDRKFVNELAPFKSTDLTRQTFLTRRILPDPIPDDIAPPPLPTSGGATVVRLKRTKTTDEPMGEPTAPSSTTTTAAHHQESSPVKQPLILQIDREMNPPVPSSNEWKSFARHLLNELSQIRDDSGGGSKLSWIFQKPIFKYELPNQIKRLYLLSVTDPIDLQVIESKLDKGVYDGGNGPLDFEHDLITMLDNCLVFNDETQYPHKVGFVMNRHFRKYWWDNGLREKAINSFKQNTALQDAKQGIVVSPESPNWSELREIAISENLKPGLDTDHISSTAPLNDELLYEWRVAQRFVMQERRRQQDRLKTNL